MGCPDQRQAVDAGDDDSRRRSTAAPRCWCRRAPSGWRSKAVPCAPCVCVPVAVNGSVSAAHAHARPGAPRRGGRRRDQLAGAAAAVRGARPARPAGPAHLPAPGGGVDGDLRRAHRRLARRAADDLQRPLPRRRRPSMAPSATSSRRRRCTRCWSSITLPGFGADMARAMQDFPRTQALLALMRDGFHEQSPGGRVGLAQRRLAPARLSAQRLRLRRRPPRAAEHGRDPVRRRRADRDAGARDGGALPQLGRGAAGHRRAADEALPDPRRQRPRDGRLRHGRASRAGRRCGPTAGTGSCENLSVHDGSLFPTSIGANPQLSIYGLVNMLASGLARELSGRSVGLA